MSADSGGRGPYERHAAAIEAETDRLAEAARNAGPDAPVPTCPGWTMTKLVKHVGIIQRWAEHIVRERVQRRISPREVPVTLPGDADGYPDWLAAGARTLAATLRAAEPGDAVWTWAPGGNARFWARRMLHEAAVHRADAEIAHGGEPRFDADVATDGVDELLANLAGAPGVLERLAALDDAGRTLHLHATDAEGGEWMITLSSEGFTWTHGHGKGDVAVRGAAGDLLLLVYGRLAPAGGRFEIFGDRDLLTRWLEATPI
ncbi:maleylpyruvate isomerase family mycothiol-dependent enzyme [Sphaerisporangium sp. NPDC051017]|uniref:maleylpyruvate isomerase family mycothiol-dependent enzyme n=1 Tax=Sphaerisporangium sp. NPDC051017 TaxID=3154636 RepID=UPI00341C441A